MKKCLAVILAMLSTVSCIYDYDPEIPAEEKRIVIEGDIVLGTVCTFTAGRMRGLDDSGKGNINVNPEFRVEDSEGNVYSSPGRGKIDLTTAPEGRKYRLYTKISYLDNAQFVEEEYVSAWATPSPAPIIGDLVTALDSLTGRKLILSLSLSSPDESVSCYRWDYEEMYRFHTVLQSPQYVFDPETREFLGPMMNMSWWQYNWCWMETTDNKAGFAIAKALEGHDLKDHAFLTYDTSSLRFHRGRDGVSRCYIRLIARTIPEECYRYLDSVEKNSENNGSLLSPLAGEVIGNIRNLADTTDYAIGYVAVTKAAKRTFRVDYSTPLQWDDEKKWEYDPLEDKPYYVSDQEKYFYDYVWGHRPYITPEKWVPLRCIDCRESGGTLEIPSGWDIDGL